MTKYKLILILLVLMLVAGVSFLFHMKGPTQRAFSSKQGLPEIVVGCDDYAPFTYRDIDGNMKGIDVEIATEAFHRMGYEPKFIFIDWEAKKFLLADRKIDCIWSCYTMTGRETEYKWAGPYMKSRQVFAVLPDSPIHTFQDLEGKTLALQSSTKPEDLLRKHAEGLPHFRRIISAQNRDLMFTLLSKGYADAIAAHDTSIEQFIKDFDLQYRILETPMQSVDLGVAFGKRDDRGLDEDLTKVLQDMQKDGTTKTIIEKYLPNGDRYLEGQP